MKEAKIGSLPWFAGVFWLLLSTVCLGAGHLFFRIGCNRAAWKAIHYTNKCNRMAFQCAEEGGAEL